MSQVSVTRGLEVFLGIMMAGFAGNTSSMISATVVSLGRILFEYGELCFTVCPQLLETIGLLLKHRAREVVGSAVGFIKVAVVKLPAAMIDSFLPALIPALTGWSTEARRCHPCCAACHVTSHACLTRFQEISHAHPHRVRQADAKVRRGTAVCACAARAL